MMKSRILITMLALALTLQACHLPTNVPSQETATSLPPQPLVTETPSLTPLPADTPIPTLTATPTTPIAWPLNQAVNCRFGPNLDWVVVGALLVGQTATILGKNEDASWWYLATPNDPGTPCWVAASVTLTAGNLAGLQIISPPKASVTKVTVQIDPAKISVAGCMGPIQPSEIKGTIEVNGPVKVEWHFETEQGGAMSPESTNFKSADTKNVSAEFTPPLSAGTYWVRLIIDSPGDKLAETKYKIVC
jgi:hypothetical protein